MPLVEKHSCRSPHRTRLGALLGATLMALACGDGAADDASPGAPPTGTDPLYAMMVQVYTADDRIVYVYLSKDLNVGAVDLSQAREFASVANFAGIDGRILVSSGTEPEIYEIGSDGVASERGDTVGDVFKWVRIR